MTLNTTMALYTKYPMSLTFFWREFQGAIGAAESLSVVASVEELEALRTSALGQVLGQGGRGGRMGGEGGGGFSNSFGGPGGVDPERLRFHLKSPHMVGLFCPYSRSLLTLVWPTQVALPAVPPGCTCTTVGNVPHVLFLRNTFDTGRN